MKEEKAKGKAVEKAGEKSKGGTGNLTTLALIMMNVTVVAGLANDVQQSFYGLSSVTFFVIGAIVFFIPTGLVAAELAGGWSERGGIFRWVGEGIGRGWAFVCIFILWFQTTFNFGSGIAGSAATIGFFTPDFDWAVDFAQHPTNEFWIMLGWLAFYWFMCFLATRGIKTFSRITKYGVFIGTLIPLAVMTILCIVWLAQGNRPNIDLSPQGLIPEWHGMTTLALAAGVFFSFAGIDMNAAHIKQLKNPARQYPLAIFVAMILALIIFILGTLIIAIVIPNDQINVLYTLFATYQALGATIGAPWLYLVFVYAGLGATIANLITNLAGPALMLGSAGRSGFLPKFLQNNNKHNMPSRLMYFQMILMSAIAFVVFLLPNVEGFVVLITQAITILYLMYYILMFIAFIRLRYTQPNRPRTFKIPGGNVVAWIVAGIGTAACIFGCVLALYPPAQVQSEVGSGTTYVTIIIVLIAVVLAVSFGIYFLSRKRDWVDPKNDFAPFTWEIEGLPKPKKVLSNVPSTIMSEGQNPMGMPILRPYDPNEQVDLAHLTDPLQAAKTPEPVAVGAAAKTVDAKAMAAAPAAAPAATAAAPAASAAAPAAAPAGGGTSSTIATAVSAAAAVAATPDKPMAAATAAAGTPAAAEATAAKPAEAAAAEAAPAESATAPKPIEVPAASQAAVAAETVPADPTKAAEDAAQMAKEAAQKAEDLMVEAEALKEEADADLKLAQAEEAAKAAQAAAAQAQKAVEEDEKKN